MSKVWILNASPLIVLGKADLLETISSVSLKWIIPQGVLKEISQKGIADKYITQISAKADVDIITVPEIDPVVRGWNLGEGESEVLSLGRQENVGVVLDDLQARKCANVLDIPLTGTLGLIVKAKHMGIIGTVKPTLDRIIRSGLYVEPELLENLMRNLGELG